MNTPRRFKLLVRGKPPFYFNFLIYHEGDPTESEWQQAEAEAMDVVRTRQGCGGHVEIERGVMW